MGYKSYCWTMGTTTFRTKEMNRDIEYQLQSIDKFWNDPKNANEVWSVREPRRQQNEPLQKRYYDTLKYEGFVSGDSKRPDKDARELTSGLVELGLLTEGRRLTEAGRKILEIALAHDFKPDNNIFEMPKDSYRYFLQLLKAQKDVAGKCVRPFVVFCNLMNKITPLDGEVFLTREEFGSLMIMCVDERTTTLVVSEINKARASGVEVDVNRVTISLLLGMENYQSALRSFLSAKSVTEDVICEIGMNRKSSAKGTKRYDKDYYAVYQWLHRMVIEGKGSFSAKDAISLLKAIQECKTSSFLKEIFFGKNNVISVSRAPLSYLKTNQPIFRCTTEHGFRKSFFKLLHLVKAKATFRDYADLNRRYFSLSDAVVFQDDKVMLDALPRVFVKRLEKWFSEESFREAHDVDKDIPLADIVGRYSFDKDELVSDAFGIDTAEMESRGGVRNVVKTERNKKFNLLLESKFPKNTIVSILEMFEDRSNDDKVKQAVTDSADIPTIYEYIVAIAWYYVGGKTGDVLDYMNLSLGADMLPKTHAGGGEADIVWKYDKTKSYPAHTVLIEVTMAEKDNQRRLELEPVPRHVGNYILSHKEENAYGVFITNYLSPSVVMNYRGYRFDEEYANDWDGESVKGMKIIPIEAKLLVAFIKKAWNYEKVYAKFDEYYNDEERDARKWYKAIRKELLG